MDDLDARLDAIFARRDRDDMAPTVAAFAAVLREHPDDARVLYELGGAYDTDGQEDLAADYYERALAGGLDGDRRRRCLLQYGSTLRNLECIDESLDVFARAVAEYPDSPALAAFRALTLHAAGRHDEAFAALLVLLVERCDSAEIRRYEAALRGNAEYLRERAVRPA